MLPGQRVIRRASFPFTRREKDTARALTHIWLAAIGRAVYLCDGMKSFSNRRWANREDLVNVPRGARECLQRARVAEGPEVR